MTLAPVHRVVTLADNTIGPAEIAAVTDVLRSRWLSMGPVTRAFERSLAAALDVPDAVVVSSGTAALHLAVLALGIGPGDEVITPSLSFVASAAMVALHGGVPVFADALSPDEPTIAVEEVRRLLTPRTRAVIVMHYGGYPARVAEIAELARARGVAVIEDAAHAPAVRVGHRFLGTVGDIGCFSFHATKNLTTGEGGAVVAADANLRDRVRRTRSHHISRPPGGKSGYDVAGLGLNYRPTEVSSAVGQVQLDRLAADRLRRAELVARYRRLLAGVAGVGIPFADHAGDSAYHLMAVVLPAGTDRETVRSALAGTGVETSVHYPPTHMFCYYRQRRAPGTAVLPVCEGMAPRLLTLPLHAKMVVDDVDHVVSSLRYALGQPGRPA